MIGYVRQKGKGECVKKMGKKKNLTDFPNQVKYNSAQPGEVDAMKW